MRRRRSRGRSRQGCCSIGKGGRIGCCSTKGPANHIRSENRLQLVPVTKEKRKTLKYHRCAGGAEGVCAPLAAARAGARPLGADAGGGKRSPALHRSIWPKFPSPPNLANSANSGCAHPSVPAVCTEGMWAVKEISVEKGG